MPIELCLVKGPEEGLTRIFSDNAEITLGRGTDADFCLKDQSVSRKHCRIKGVNGLFMIRDYGSGNGTKVNNQQIDYAVLKDGDTIEIGLTHVRIQLIN